ncbi:MAG: hypothetical protein Q8N84_00565 [bacterium]|nr:hypothetical protein [bacterium]
MEFKPLPKKFSRRKIIWGFFLVVLAGSGFWFWQKSGWQKNAPTVSGLQQEKEITVASLLPLPSAVFGQDALASQFPTDLDFYWEGSGLEKLAAAILGQDFSAEFLEAFGIPPQEGATFVSSAYAVGGWQEGEVPYEGTSSAVSWLILTKVKGQEFLAQKLPDFPTKVWTGWQAKLVGEYLALSNSESRLAELEKVGTGEVANVGKLISTSNQRSRLPAAGLAWILTKGERGRLVAERWLSVFGGQSFLTAFDLLGGEGFVLTTKGEETVVWGSD